MSGLTTRRIDPTTVTAEELEAIDGVIQRAYRMPSRMTRIKRFLLVEGGTWAVTEADGALVSVGASIAYPDGGFGWIGLIGTDPAMAGLGGGRLVTQFLIDGLAAQGCRSALDASAAGAPLYRAMNFTDHGQVTKLYAPAGAWSSSPEALDGASVSAAPNEFTVHRLDLSQLKELVGYDAKVFGAHRIGLLRYIIEQAPNCCFVARAVPTEMIIGYVISQADCIGPFCADNAFVVDALIGMALSCPWRRAPEMIVPNGNGYLERFLATGWTIDRTLHHQRLELSELPGDRTCLVAQVSFGEG
jgi:hypothetical protein